MQARTLLAHEVHDLDRRGPLDRRADGALAAEGHLAEGTCDLWPIMAPDGLTLSEDNVGPFIVDFAKIDTKTA